MQYEYESQFIKLHPCFPHSRPRTATITQIVCIGIRILDPCTFGRNVLDSYIRTAISQNKFKLPHPNGHSVCRQKLSCSWAPTCLVHDAETRNRLLLLLLADDPQGGNSSDVLRAPKPLSRRFGSSTFQRARSGKLQLLSMHLIFRLPPFWDLAWLPL